MSSTHPSDNVWIYHERQEAQLCGQHALNNLAQDNVFTVGLLSEKAHQLDWAEQAVLTGQDRLTAASQPSSNVDEAGNFSIQVLKAALEERYPVILTHLNHADLFATSTTTETNGRRKRDITDMQGFLCHKSDHWFAIRLIGGRFWNLNSTEEKPVVVSHFHLATEMQNCAADGYTVFAVPTGLPEAGVKRLSSTGDKSKSCRWHRMSALLRGSSDSNADAWENTGTGMRLDGKSVAAASTTAMAQSIEGLTEEEQLQFALQASMASTSENNNAVANTASSGLDEVTVSTEPPEGAADCVKVQFRLPNGKRIIRRFNKSDSVMAVYAFVHQQSSSTAGGSSSKLELRFGFPPRDLSGQRNATIEEAKLAGESIQGRYVQ